MMLDKNILISMISGETPRYWVRDAMDLLPDGSAIQVILIPARGRGSEAGEPFPGLTEQILKLATSERAEAILGMLADKDRKVLNLKLRTDTGGTHAEVAQ